MIDMVEPTVERDGKTQRERRYYLSSAKLDARTFAAAAVCSPLGRREPAALGA